MSGLFKNLMKFSEQFLSNKKTCGFVCRAPALIMYIDLYKVVDIKYKLLNKQLNYANGNIF